MKNKSILIGAAFLMATSAIGPGFLTHTTYYSQTLLASFGFAILISIILDIGAQLNVWRIVSVSKMRAQDVGNAIYPRLGDFLTLLIVLGGLAFNIGNIAGAGLGMQMLFSVDIITGSLISAVIAISIFLSKQAGKWLDKFTVIAGFAMIAITLTVVILSHPPLGHIIQKSIFPDQIDITTIVTLVGGTVGGYIMFSGVHRLLDAGIAGKEHIKEVTKSAVIGITVAGIMRIVLFLAAIGVVLGGGALDPTNPAASVFSIVLGDIGYKFFGAVLWVAAISSVVGAAYTSVSFLRSFNTFFDKNNRYLVILFILISTLIFVILGHKPVNVLIFVGTLNGWILPISLTIMLLAAYNKNIVGDYQHPKWMSAFGLIIALASGIMAILSILKVTGLI